MPLLFAFSFFLGGGAGGAIDLTTAVSVGPGFAAGAPIFCSGSMLLVIS